MNEYIKKNINKIFLIFFYLQPVIDLITSLCINVLNIDITFGVIIRTLFLVFIFIYIIINKLVDKKRIIYLFILLGYGVLYSTNILLSKDISSLVYEGSNVVKYLYLPLLVLFMNSIDIKIEYRDIIRIAFIYIILIFIPSILNIDFNSYTQGKVGSVGLFNSGNEISAILSILCPFIVNYFIYEKNIIKKIILSLVSLYCFFVMGSKIIIISLFVSIIVNIVLYIKNNKLNKKVMCISTIFIIIFCVCGVLLIPKTNFYKNIVLHMNFLGINSISDVFSYNSINRFIFSDRLSFFNETGNYYLNGSVLDKLVGVGFIENYATDHVSLKVIEMDFCDLFFRLGIIGFVLFFIPFIFMIKDNSGKIKPNYLVNTSLILMGLIALMVGHTISAPAVSIYFLILIFYNKGISI